MSTQFDPTIHCQRSTANVRDLGSILQRLNQKLQQDKLVQTNIDHLRDFLKVDRVVLYYFYKQWEGQVTLESLSSPKLSIIGSTGPDQCFSDEYAALYLDGRVRSIADIETAQIQPCHRDFLRYLQVRANLVVPILTDQGLWGLLVAHHCQSPRPWSDAEIAQMQESALTLATAAAIKGS